ncbi:acyl-CoA thioesterase [Propionibacterium sp. oral taxon 192]|uniref:acyl-CoA thioesterase n=1 Tax=Propionibacterium sp. oral taxon 192 TaxID=671222 RepID=UPI0003A2B7A1|nr:acyl-CoA thioesterase II [Propionibacterium sp. oral taxon 192]
MPATTQAVVDLLTLTGPDRDHCVGAHPRTLMQRTYGGQVLAQALMAAHRTVPDDRQVHSLHACFVRPGAPDADICFATENIRDGGSFSTRQVIGRQLVTDQDKEIFRMTASFHITEPGLDHADPMPSDVPGPEDCPTFVEYMDATIGPSPLWREWDALDVRFAGDSAPGGVIKPGRHVASMRIWMRTRDMLPTDSRIHRAMLAYMSDLTLLSVSAVPHPVAFISKQLQTASLDHAMWFHRDFRADEWLLYDMYSQSASGGLGHGSGRIFQNKLLVSATAQEGLIRPVEDRAVLS